jgi:uncharacterized membrane protein YdfJ with MMPL/SSD domain
VFAALGAFVVKHRWQTLAVTLAFTAVAAVAAVGGLSRLSFGGELQSDAESVQAADSVRDHLGHGGADLLLGYRDDTRSSSDPAFRAEIEGYLKDAPPGLITAAMTPWSSGLAALRSADGHAVVVPIMLAGTDDTGRTRSYQALRAAVHPAGVTYSGPIAIREAVVTQAQADLFRTELLVMPAVLLLLVLLFRSLVAALLPVVVGGLTLVVTLGLMRPLTGVMEVSALAVNAVTVLCLAVAVDSALFVVGRFREELSKRGAVDAAVVAAVATAGRTCFFSGATIGLVTLGLTVFPTGLTRSIGVCTAIAMAVGTTLSVTLLPALLAVLGRRVNLLRIPLPSRWTRSGFGDRFWGAVGRAVIAEPVGYLLAAVTVLVVLASPFLHTSLGFPDQRALPASAPARVATDDQRRDFAVPALDLVQVVTRFGEPVETAAGRAAVASWTRQVTLLPGVRGMAAAAESGDYQVSYVYAGAAESPSVLELVREIRRLPPPPGGLVLVGGAAAMAVDTFDLLADRLPWVLGFVALMALVLLGVLLRSVVLPLKALLVNALSLGASFGALTWIFQDGHFVWLVGANRTGYIDVIQPFLLLVILIGLSMDYEFFLLSRIKEQYDRTGDNNAAIVAGLQRSAPVFTGAALVVMLVAAVFATSQIVFIKQLCVGIFIAVAVDATLVRAVVVPAAMRLLGRANWWWPRRRRRSGEPATQGDRSLVRSGPSAMAVESTRR